ncbi:MAG: hypothetical protein R3D02_09195 [Hyphomicrobiales bacterium]
MAKITAAFPASWWRFLVAAVLRGVPLAFAYALAVGVAVLVNVALMDQAFGGRVTTLVVIFVLGSLFGGVFAYGTGAFFGRGRSSSQRFAAMMAGLVFFTGGVTTAFYALQFRAYFVSSHDPFLQGYWLQQNLMTMAAAVYQFATAGLRYLLPAGLPVLFGAALLFSVSARRFNADWRD